MIPPSFNQRGFTLIEMLLGIVIMGVAISMLSVSINQSVRNQEKMQRLLNLYQVALTTQPLIIDKLKKGELRGSYKTGNVEVKWEAQSKDQKDEAPVFILDAGGYSTGAFSIYFYEVTTIVESPYARRVYIFDQMIERHKSESQNRFGR